MQAPDPVEAILARLTPAAMSENYHNRLDGVVNQLAQPAPQQSLPISRRRWFVAWSAGGAVAAAVGLLASLHFGKNSLPEVNAGPLIQEMSSGLILVSESDRVESLTDEGLKFSADGSAMRALRLKTVEKNRVFDEKSGIYVEISEPREEILLTPPSDF